MFSQIIYKPQRTGVSGWLLWVNNTMDRYFILFFLNLSRCLSSSGGKEGVHLWEWEDKYTIVLKAVIKWKPFKMWPKTLETHRWIWKVISWARFRSTPQVVAGINFYISVDPTITAVRTARIQLSTEISSLTTDGAIFEHICLLNGIQIEYSLHRSLVVSVGHLLSYSLKTCTWALLAPNISGKEESFLI